METRVVNLTNEEIAFLSWAVATLNKSGHVTITAEYAAELKTLIVDKFGLDESIYNRVLAGDELVFKAIRDFN